MEVPTLPTLKEDKYIKEAKQYVEKNSIEGMVMLIIFMIQLIIILYVLETFPGKCGFDKIDLIKI